MITLYVSSLNVSFNYHSGNIIYLNDKGSSFISIWIYFGEIIKSMVHNLDF